MDVDNLDSRNTGALDRTGWASVMTEHIQALRSAVVLKKKKKGLLKNS
jgi:hypothetical protein